MLAVPVQHLLVGGALTGVLIGIAAQQALGNVFAGLVLLLNRPVTIGDHIRIRSGALGGEFDGTVTGMELTYVALDTTSGPLQVPNASIRAAAVGPWTEAATQDATAADQPRSNTSPTRVKSRARADMMWRVGLPSSPMARVVVGEHTFDRWEALVTLATQTQSAAGSRARPALAGAPQAYATRRAALTQVRQQRRRYAGAVLASLARSYSGRPIPEIVTVLQQALKPCGVRLSPDAWRNLAANINARRPVTL